MARKAVYPHLLFAFLFTILLLLFVGVSPGQTVDVKGLFERMKRGFDQLEDYQCIYESYASNRKGLHKNTFQYYFKKPKLIRMEVKEGAHAGTILIYNPILAPGKVRVKMRNRLRGVVQKLFYGEFIDLDDERVKGLRGYGIDESDWGWFIDKHLRIAESNGKTFEVEFGGIGETNGRGTLSYILTSRNPAETLSIKKEKLWIDKETHLPIQYRLYDSSGRLMQSCSYEQIIINSNLKDALFKDADLTCQKDRKQNRPTEYSQEKIEVLPP
jgi:outer membrane lipoprotein-sorting protein